MKTLLMWLASVTTLTFTTLAAEADQPMTAQLKDLQVKSQHRRCDGRREH